MKKKDIIQLVKKTIKEVEQSQHVQRSSGGGASVIAPAGKDPYTGEDEYPNSVRPKRTATGMMEDKLDEEGASWGLDIRKLADSFTFDELEQLKNDGKIKPEDYNGAVGYLQAWADQHPTFLKQRDFDDENSFGYETRKALRDKYLSEAPMFKTDVKQDMAPKEMAGRIKSIFDKINGAKDPVKTPEWHKNRFKDKTGISFPETLKGINKDQAIEMNKYANDMKIKESAEDDAAEEMQLKALLLQKKAIDTKMANIKMGKNSVTENELEKDISVSNKDIETLDALVKMYNAEALISRIKVLEKTPLSYNPKVKSAELDDEDMDQKYDDIKQDIASMMEDLKEGGNFVDHEGRHAKMQLQKAAEYSVKLAKMMDDMTQLPSWVQSKITKASDYMSAVYHYLDYEMTNSQDNLMENIDKYKKRSILMEGAMKQFFEMFDKGKTDEEIVQDYAQRGTQVPEPFVSKARKQYQGMKKLKLELEMSEKEFRNSSEKMVNNAEEGMGYEGEEKTLASGLTNEEPNEGNKFTKELEKARDAGKDSFELDGEEIEIEK